jgi:hypothetical protein
MNDGCVVQSAVIIDPINLMLFDPAVASNFVHRRPCNSIQLMMSYFVSQELYIAHTLARMFSWSHAVLFLECIPEDVRVEVLLSGDDAIVVSIFGNSTSPAILSLESEDLGYRLTQVDRTEAVLKK